MRAAPGAVASFIAFLLLGAAGCTHYTLTPPPPTAMPKSSGPPLPLRVGLVLDQRRDALSLRGAQNASDYAFGPKLAQALRQSGLFEDVLFPLSPARRALSGADLLLSAQFGSRFDQDPLQGPKIIFVVFTGLITGAVLTETSHHRAQGVLSVEDASGRSLRGYDETADVKAVSMVSMFAEMKTMKAGPPAAGDALIAKLVQRLIDDRAFFASRRPGPAKAPESVASAPEPPTAQAAAPEAAEPEAAPARLQAVLPHISDAEARAELLP